jgi:hypothetical protein
MRLPNTNQIAEENGSLKDVAVRDSYKTVWLFNSRGEIRYDGVMYWHQKVRRGLRLAHRLITQLKAERRRLNRTFSLISDSHISERNHLEAFELRLRTENKDLQREIVAITSRINNLQRYYQECIHAQHTLKALLTYDSLTRNSNASVCSSLQNSVA